MLKEVRLLQLGVGGTPGCVGQSDGEEQLFPLGFFGFAATARREAWECVSAADGDIILFLLVRDTEEGSQEKRLVGEQRGGWSLCLAQAHQEFHPLNLPICRSGIIPSQPPSFLPSFLVLHSFLNARGLKRVSAELSASGTQGASRHSLVWLAAHVLGPPLSPD